jgi:formylglycine-generating enzyme required for sulfatase activity
MPVESGYFQHMDPRRFAWDDPMGRHELVLAWVPGTAGTPNAFGNGQKRRSIELAGFFVGTTPVTQALWTRVMGENPAVHRNPRCPVENVPWERVTGPASGKRGLCRGRRPEIPMDHPRLVNQHGPDDRHRLRGSGEELSTRHQEVGPRQLRELPGRQPVDH